MSEQPLLMDLGVQCSTAGCVVAQFHWVHQDGDGRAWIDWADPS